MQVRHILVSAAVDNEAVAGRLQVKLGYQVLHGLEEVSEEVGIGRAQVHQGCQFPFGNQYNVDWVARPGMVKGDERGGFAQPLNREGKTHIGK